MRAPNAVQLAPAVVRVGLSSTWRDDGEPKDESGAWVVAVAISRGKSFPVSPMKTVSSVGSATLRSASVKPAASAASTTLGTRRSVPRT